MLYEPNLYAMVSCPSCGKHYLSDCGVDFCSSSCEEAYEEYHKECERCGCEQEEDTFPDGEHCENCLDEMEEEKAEIEIILPSAM